MFDFVVCFLVAVLAVLIWSMIEAFIDWNGRCDCGGTWVSNGTFGAKGHVLFRCGRCHKTK